MAIKSPMISTGPTANVEKVGQSPAVERLIINSSFLPGQPHLYYDASGATISVPTTPLYEGQLMGYLDLPYTILHCAVNTGTGLQWKRCTITSPPINSNSGKAFDPNYGL